ncbi:hypothetical protein IMG5_147740 [Ichthyophthirius multifiliis]|uniref:Sperm-tail PG-rich repeat protein n=1 Tax=Ichthyophthirius multifiliis TaxID=5932 RepID=G0QY71_ICHMU|nr:hypothetical protein IMG5_147740 [Ichthyophthirius multifiliis]EGR29845.1 hypothetical protein IMG5_147740 [Ichthyophthirius multifiliis]|eukprot:XP_004031081.1 hypothetical protein IMG5_147740 [Ichthyophthirius multifiliis]
MQYQQQREETNENLRKLKQIRGADHKSNQNFYQLSQSPDYNSSNLFACPQGMGMSQYIGSSSLRHASLYTTFSKAERFPQNKISEAQASQNINLPPTITKKTCTFGFGTKYLYPQNVLKNARDYPSPNHYQRIKTQVNTKMGKTFGIPYKFYNKTYIPKNNLQTVEFARELPGVGQYEVIQGPGKDKLKYSLYGKIKERTYFFYNLLN